jgi:hypothetical protein
MGGRSGVGLSCRSPDVVLTIAVPFRGQADKFSPLQQARYQEILDMQMKWSCFKSSTPRIAFSSETTI